MADRSALPEFTVSRIRYYDGLFLTDEDFIEEQNYHLGQQRRHEHLLHTAGITEGLDVTITSAGVKVAIAAGSAVNSEGRQILLAAGTTVTVDPLWNDGVRYLEMTFHEAEDRFADANSTVVAATRLSQSPTFALVTARTATAVLLAKVSIVGGIAVSVDASTRVYSGLRLPGPTSVGAVTLTSNSAGGTAVLAGALNVDGVTSLDSTLNVTGATALASTLNVTGATTLASTLGVVGATSLNNTLGVAGATSLNNTLGVAGATSLNNTLAVAGATSLNNTLGVTGNTALATAPGSLLTVAGASTINNTLEVTGATTLASGAGSSLTVVGAAYLSSTLAVTSTTTLSSTLSVSGASKISASFETTGNTLLASASGSTLNVSGATKVSNTFESTGNTKLASTAGSTLTVSGATTINNTLESAGNTKLASTSGSTLTVSGATTINNTLESTGNTKLASTSGSTLTVSGATTINNTLESTGNTKLASTSGSTLTVSGATTINNTLESTGNTKLASTSGSMLTVSGATKVSNTFESTGNTSLATTAGSLLLVSGATKISNIFESTGNTKLASNSGTTVTIYGATTVPNTFESTGNTKLASTSGSTLTVSGATTVSNTFESTGNTKLASTSGSTLTVSGATTVSNTFESTGNTKLASTSGSTLTVSGATTVSNTFEATGNTKLASASGSTLTVSGATTVSNTLGVTGASTFSADMTIAGAAGTRVLTFDNVATSKILFRSSANVGSDVGFIVYRGNSSFVDSLFDTAGTNPENSRLSIGLGDDYANTSAYKPADALDIQGSAQLTLNAGRWDTETDSLIGTQWTPTGLGSTNGISFRIDNTEKMRLNGTNFTVSTDLVMSGDRTLNFDNTAQSLIVWNSSANYGSDKAFILFKADSTQHGTNTENSRLSVGVFNDFDSTNADALDLQGGYKLKLNAGDWDDELDTAIGVPGGTSGAYGISLCVNNSEKMKIDSSGITVPSNVSVSGLSVVEIKTGHHDFSSSGPVQTKVITVTFSRTLSSATAVLQGWWLKYTNSHTDLQKSGAWIDPVSISGSTCTFTVHGMWEDTNYDDDWTGQLYYSVIGILKSTV